MKLYTIWSNIDPDLEALRAAALEEAPALAGDAEALERRALELNNLRLLDERINFDEPLDAPLLAIANIEVEGERIPACKLFGSGNLSDVLYSQCVQAEWFVDDKGDLRGTGIYPNGINRVLYRMFKRNTPAERQNELAQRICDGLATEEEIRANTVRLGDHIAKIYKFELPTE